MLMGSVFEAFVTNPALYSAGHLVGETLRFPTTTEEVQALLKRIGVDGVRCQEWKTPKPRFYRICTRSF